MRIGSQIPEHSLAPFCDNFLKDRLGAAAVEFAILAPTLILVAFGATDYGALLFQGMEVSTAAQAGAQYALRYGWNTAAIQSAVAGATSLNVTATPAPALLSLCVSNAKLVTAIGNMCPGGGAAGAYVLVSAQAAVTPVVPWPSFAIPSTVSAQAEIRIN